MSAGISNGGWFQPMFLRVASISAAPSGSPWVLALPALLGEPKPMIVLQQISVGRSCCERASLTASAMAWALLPSTARMTFHP